MNCKPILWLLTLLALPMAAIAENEIVLLPTLAPMVTVRVEINEYAVDLEGYYAEISADDASSQYPSLRSAEKARVPEIQARYDAGERPAQNVLNKETDVVVGVYALNPEEYQGESVYVLLPSIPGCDLTDEELLEIIDAYAQLGLRFDADGLSWRNCMRGGGLEGNRACAGDERERRDTLTNLYKRQNLRPVQPFTAIPGDDGIGEIGLREAAYSGLPGYRLYPCRRMTDEELLRLVQNDVGDNVPAPLAYGEYERQAREQLHALFDAPPALKLASEEMAKASDFSVFNDDREVYQVCFASAASGADALAYRLLLDVKTGLIYEADLSPIQYDALLYSDLRCDPFDEKWLAIGREAVSAMRTDGMAITSVESFGEEGLQYGGYCAVILVTMADGSAYDLRIPFQTERMLDCVYRQIPITPEQSAENN
ncbi:MAG: hypothetical protein RSC91_10550 [Clostridia bacterium]